MKKVFFISALLAFSVHSFAGVLTCKGRNHLAVIDSTKKVFKVEPGLSKFIRGEMPSVGKSDKSFFALNSESGYAVFINAQGKAEINYQGNVLESNINCKGTL